MTESQAEKKFIFKTKNDVLNETIENCLIDIIHSFGENTLPNLSSLYKYINIGGKAINKFISRRFLKRSFDYDVSIYEENPHKVEEFCISWCNLLNNFLNKMHSNLDSPYRHYIFYALKQYDLVDDSNWEHYEKGNLFYFGEYSPLGGNNVYNPIKHIYIKLVLKKTLFGDNIPFTNDIDKINDASAHEIYLSIADVAYIEGLNKNYIGKHIDRNDPKSNYFMTENKGNVLNIIPIIYNLLKVITKTSNKRDNNLIKLTNLINMYKYKCNSIVGIMKYLSYDPSEILTSADKFFVNPEQKLGLRSSIDNLFKNNSGSQEKNDLYDLFGLNDNENTHVFTIIEKIMKMHKLYFEKFNNDCRSNIFLSTGEVQEDENFMYNRNIDYTVARNAIEKFTYNIDKQRVILLYTTGQFYYELSNYYENLILSKSPQKNINVDSNLIDFINVNNKIKIGNEQLEIGGNIPTSISVAYVDKYLRTLMIEQNKFINNSKNVDDYINNEYYLNTLQNFIYLNNYEGTLISPSFMKEGHVIRSNKFLSFSYSKNYTYEDFVKNDDSYLMRLKIKRSDLALYIGNYSFFPKQHEVILPPGVFFKITNVKYVDVMKSGFPFEIMMFDAELFGRLDNVIKSFSPKSTIYIHNALEHFLDSDVKMSDLQGVHIQRKTNVKRDEIIRKKRMSDPNDLDTVMMENVRENIDEQSYLNKRNRIGGGDGMEIIYTNTIFIEIPKNISETYEFSLNFLKKENENFKNIVKDQLIFEITVDQNNFLPPNIDYDALNLPIYANGGGHEIDYKMIYKKNKNDYIKMVNNN
jgi:hypothetical protein